MDVVLEKKLSGYKQIALEKLDNVLLKIFGRKDLVIEPEMIRILDSFANMTWLKSKGFDKVFKLSSSLPPKTKTLVYMIFSNLVTFKHILDQISLLKSSAPPELDGVKEFHIIVIPSLFFVFQNLVETEGLAGFVSLHGFSWDFLKVDRNLMLLEFPSTFQQVFIKKDKSLLSSITKSLRIFGYVHKRPSIVLTIGGNAEKVIGMLTKMKKPANSENPDFNAMIVVDRDADYPSCLLTPVTYSGLMLELFDMKGGILNIEDENKVSNGKLEFLKEDSKTPDSHQEDIKTLRMCGTSDELYTANKYKHFSDVVNLIKSESKSLDQERRKYSRDMNLEQMKDYVEQNLPKVAAQKKILYKHLIICEKIVQELSLNFEKLQNVEEWILRNENHKQIVAFIDENLSTNAHRWNVLRLLALLHIFNGLSGEEVNRMTQNYLNAFGHQFMYIFHNLQKARLFPDILRPSPKNLMTMASSLTKKTQFMSDAVRFKLIPTIETGGQDKNRSITSKICPSYVFNGNYIPFVAQVARNLLQAQNHQDLMGKFAGIDVKIVQSDENELKSLKDVQCVKKLPLKPKTIFIFVIGGVSYAEVAACKMIESLTGATIVLGSDEITSGMNLIKSAV